MKTNWLWDTKLNDAEVRVILGNEKDPRFFIYASKLLARLKDPEIVFSYIDKALLQRHWPAIRSRMKRDTWGADAVREWQKFFVSGISPERLVVAQQIRSARRASGLSQAGFARQMGVIQQYVSSLESGKENVTIDTLTKVAASFGKKVVIRFENNLPNLRG
jgi:DNA-binding XRE family transcriptional regulator